MNIPAIQIPPETPLPMGQAGANAACPKAPQKTIHLSWANAVRSKPEVSRKLVFDDEKDNKKKPKNDFSIKNNR